MSTKQEYSQLWESFEKILKKKNLSLEDFARKWEEEHPDDNSATYRTFIKQLKAKWERREKTQRINSTTLAQMRDYINFLNDYEAKFESLDDEQFGNLF